MEQKLFWKGFFLFLVILNVASLLLPSFVPPFARPLDRTVEFVALPFSLVQLAGIFGLAYARPIAKPWIWKAIFGVTLLNELWALSTLVIGSSFPLSYSFTLKVVAVVVVIAVPLCLGLYNYAFEQENLWSKAT